jgi:outer membrane protein OmpA-like peptidoglycan-associated protein
MNEHSHVLSGRHPAKQGVGSHVMCVVLWLATGPAVAQVPEIEHSADDLVKIFARPSLGTMGILPDATTNICRRQTGLGRMNLEVVPYGGERTAGVELRQIQFEIGSDRISPISVGQLLELATAMQREELRDMRFSISGHTDKTGPDRFNQELSCGRALAVTSFLVSKGVDPRRLTAYGFGSLKLVRGYPDSDPVHRRVEVRREP